ncbi:hypothetical protein P691DRAFT_729223 [Macrolepiota fuliginosa MF-IS2]|uniref:F-box domain-containing protein n=1 Tax=Macrolepiota fuliginosa MF-IS2 TaxID=1400762 RepID=A0A9P5XDH9_9AGAR|nr:hypothetical protein P691DRAFT_729223 [Macrolepiota fuliginosa MF-IS2]
MAHQEAPWLQEETIAIQMANSSLVATTIKVTLLELPPEILIRILLGLPFTSVVICRRVNRYLQILISESAEVQYRIHLGISGLVDNPSCNLPVSERLSRLLAKERRWEDVNFDFNKIIDVPFQFPYYHTRLITGFFSGITANEIHCMETPSAPDWEAKWRRVSPGKRIISTGTCVYEHDLHVLITAQPQTIYTNATEPRTVYEIQVHLNQLSTGQPHPGAQQATISLITHEGFGEPHVFVEHAGNNLLLMLRDNIDTQRPDEQVYVYDWRTSELKLRLSAPFRSYGYPLVLTKDVFLLTNARTGELEYWRFPKSPSEPIQHEPFFVLCLPQLVSDRAFLYISCRAEPNPSTRSCNGSKSFYNDPNEAIVTFIVGIRSTMFAVHLYTFFVHRSFFVGCPNKFYSFMSPDGRPKPVPYGEWGPSACRWFKANMFQAKWFETTSGQRCIASPPDTTAAPITLLDFNPIGVSIALARENPPTEIATYDPPGELRPREKTVIRSTDPLDDPHGCFENTVYSSLPYVMRTSQDKYSFDALLLDEESVLGIREDGSGRVIEIHVLSYG